MRFRKKPSLLERSDGLSGFRAEGLLAFFHGNTEVAVWAIGDGLAEAEEDDFGAVDVEGSFDDVDGVGDVVPLVELA